MLNFDEKIYKEASNYNINLKGEIDEVVDKVCKKGFKNIFLVGAGGTYSDMLEVEAVFKAYSTLDVYIEIAAELYTLGNKHLTDESIVVVMSESGNTKEIIKVLDYAKEIGAETIAFIATPNSPIERAADNHIRYMNTKETFMDHAFVNLYYLAFRFMHNNGEFPKYEQFMKEMKSLPEGLLQVRKDFDSVADEYTEKYKDEKEFMISSTGNTWGAAYCFAMCILEEMQWLKTKSIHGAELFHGTLELINRDTKMMLFKGEDATRPLMDRVENFANKVCNHVTVFDTKDYPIEGISEEFRDLMSPFIVAAMMERLSKHFEEKRKHNLSIRRYYKVMDY